MDALGIAAALKVEDAVFAPAMFVIADQATPRVSRETGLAGTRQTEEQRHFAIRPDICRTVHGQYTFGRQEIIENSKNGFFHLTCIMRASNQNQALLEIQDHRRL